MPVALNCSSAPLGIVGLTGVTAILASVAALTVAEVEPVIPLRVALIVAVPTAIPLAKPLVPSFFEFDTLSIFLFDERHVAMFVISCVLLSVKMPVAVYCVCSPTEIDWLIGVTSMDDKAAGLTLIRVCPVMLPNVATTFVRPTSTANTAPWLPGWLDAIAISVDAVLQVTSLVISFVLPSA